MAEDETRPGSGAALPGLEEHAGRMADALRESGISVEDARRRVGREIAGSVVVPADGERPPARTAADVPHWETGLSLSVTADFTATGRVAGPFTEDEACKLVAPIKMRQVGWLDQRGRVWLECPPSAGFDGGSLTPLLIQLSYDE